MKFIIVAFDKVRLSSSVMFYVELLTASGFKYTTLPEQAQRFDTVESAINTIQTRNQLGGISTTQFALVPIEVAFTVLI